VVDKFRARLGGRLQLAVSGGAALTPAVARVFLSMGLDLVQGYGMTETAPVVSCNVPSDNDPVSVGLPLPGIEVRTGENDELLVKTPGRMLGYWNNHKATTEVIDPDGWVHTGDKARIEDDHIYITGRIKDILVLSNGEKIPPADMEAAITLDPLFEQAMVIGEGRPFLGALVVLNPDKWFGLAQEHELDPFNHHVLQDSRLHKSLLTKVGDLLHDFPGYAKIRRVAPLLEGWTIENGLLTPTLKVKRNVVLEHHARLVESLYQQ
jgi:long-chain acyl-CoA synthetase